MNFTNVIEDSVLRFICDMAEKISSFQKSMTIPSARCPFVDWYTKIYPKTYSN